MQRLTEETRYDDAAQRQIIALAAELQRNEREGATLADLEARAIEAGIDPKYVRIAVGNATPPRSPLLAMPLNGDRRWYRNNEMTLIVVVAFAVMQVFTVTEMMAANYFPFPRALLIAPILGVAFSRNTAHRFGAAATVIGSMITTVILAVLWSGLSGSRLVSQWWENVLLLGFIEILFLLVGFAIAATARRFRRRRTA